MQRKSNPLFQVALTASTFEWYEFALTSYMALEIGRLFFPAGADKTALFLSFSLLAATYLARPVGSVFFGVWGNRHGAGAALKLSMIVMAVPTVVIAFLPTYQTAGYWASGALVGLKMLQGFAAGGEVPLNAYYVATHTQGRKRAVYCAVACASGILGMLMASFVVYVLPWCAAAVARWSGTGLDGTPLGAAWRWPFLLGIPLSFWIIRVRAALPVCSERPRTGMARRPLAPLWQAAALTGFSEMFLYAVFIWLPSYLRVYLQVPSADAHASNVLALVVLAATMIASGYIERWIAPAKLMLCAICALVLSSYPLFLALQSGSFAILLAAQLAFAAMGGALFGLLFLLLADLFKDNWQSLGMAVGFTLPTAVFGGSAPVVCAYLVDATGLLSAPALYIVCAGLIAAPVAYQLAYGVKPARRRTSLAA